MYGVWAARVGQRGGSRRDRRGILLFRSLCAAAALFLTTPAMAADYRSLDGKLDPLVTESLEKSQAAGLSIAVVNAEGVVWSKGYGFADKAQGVRALPDTPYRTSAISGLLTAAEILRRADRGELRLDDPLTAHLPGFSIHSRFGNAKPITIRALLAHHAGLPSQIHKGSVLPAGQQNPATGSLAALQEQMRAAYLAEAPQAHYKASLLGYSLLGRLIEVKDGRPFAQAMETNLLQPLGMSRATFGPGPAVPALAKPHRAGKELGAVELRDRPGSSLIASVNDLAQFVRFTLGGGRMAGGQVLLRPETLKSMFEPQFAGQPLDFGHRHGLGWNIEGVSIPGAGPVAWTGGLYPGYNSFLAVAREQELGVVVLSNDGAAGELTRQLAVKALEAAVGLKLQRPASADAAQALAASTAYRSSNAGDYAGDYLVFGQLVHLEAGDGKLSGDAFGRRFELIPAGNGRFTPQIKVLGSLDVFGLFDRSLPEFQVHTVTIAGRRFGVLEGMPEPYVFERIERRPLPAAWLPRLGKYRCDNQDEAVELKDVRLFTANDMLTVSVKASSKPLAFQDTELQRVLVPLSDDEAIVPGVGAEEGDTLKAFERDGRVSLTFSGYSFSLQP